MKILTKIFQFFPPEVSHYLALESLKLLKKLGIMKILFPIKNYSDGQKNYLNLHFRNKLGVAAGLDKNGDFFNSLGALGFGFIEVGTITPVAQSGNPKPRIFRFLDQGAIVNRLGFNNKGVDYLVKKIKLRNFNGILGINIGANKTSEGQKRVDDYLECFKKVYPYADYITVNISSPNTPNLSSN